jgi:hypothetical protein
VEGPEPRILNPETSYNVLVAQVFLAGKDWQARALLRAQLLEEGVSVEAFETVREALAQLESYPVRPSLLVADVSASDHPSADVDSLASWATRIPVWIIASHTSIVTGGLDGSGLRGSSFVLWTWENSSSRFGNELGGSRQWADRQMGSRQWAVGRSADGQ